MLIAVAHLPATPEWEVKCALALHQYQDIEQVDALQRRIAEIVPAQLGDNAGVMGAGVLVLDRVEEITRLI